MYYIYQRLLGEKTKNLRALLTNLVLEIYKYTAEEERRKTLSLQRQGIEIAKKKGTYKRRKREYSLSGSKCFLCNGVISGLKNEQSIAQISREIGIERIRVYLIRDYARKINNL